MRKQVEEVAFGDEIKEDPFLRGKVQKLTGYQEYYKIRFGSYTNLHHEITLSKV